MYIQGRPYSNHCSHFSIMSNMKKSWTIEETVVLIYFTSFRVPQEACKALIQQKCHSERDLGSIRGKVISVRNAVLQAGNPSLYDSKTKLWNRNNVDAWIAANGKHLANIKHLIRFGEFEQKLIKRQYHNRLKDLISRSQKQIDSRSQSSLALPLQAAANISPHQLLEGVGNCNNPHRWALIESIGLWLIIIVPLRKMPLRFPHHHS